MITFLVTNENSCCRRAIISSRLKQSFRTVSFDGLYETEPTERNVCLQLCISLWSLALGKRHEKAQSVCRRVRKVAIGMRMTSILKTVPVSYRLHIICLISFPYSAVNWTLFLRKFFTPRPSSIDDFSWHTPNIILCSFVLQFQACCESNLMSKFTCWASALLQFSFLFHL
jgi:hypothetical protein